MTYLEAKAHRDRIDTQAQMASDALQAFPKTGLMGMTSDNVKCSADFQAAQCVYRKASNALREFNGWYLKAFKKEITAERKARFSGNS